MQTQVAYNWWAKTYDSGVNKTRDLEGVAIKAVLGSSLYCSILELGCGTGKNTAWLADKCQILNAVDFSEEMLNIARQKIRSEKVHFHRSDITQSWDFDKVDLITCSLVLEHIQDISFVFQQASSKLPPDGQLYICELHPYKQLNGSRAKFELEGNVLSLEYFVHHISDYLEAAKSSGFACEQMKEWFDNEDRMQIPRLVSFLFRKIEPLRYSRL